MAGPIAYGAAGEGTAGIPMDGGVAVGIAGWPNVLPPKPVDNSVTYDLMTASAGLINAATEFPPQLTIRDHFAIAALHALTTLVSETKDRGKIARLAYSWADAMLEARDIPPDHLPNLVNHHFK